MIGNADDVAGPGFVHRLALGGEEQDRIVDRRSALPVPDCFSFMPRRKRPETQPQERHAVAMVGVHIGLNLEDEAGDVVFARRDQTVGRLHVAGRRRVLGQKRDQLLDPEILERRAEEHRRQQAFVIAVGVEMRQAGLDELDLLFELGDRPSAPRNSASALLPMALGSDFGRRRE